MILALLPLLSCLAAPRLGDGFTATVGGEAATVLFPASGQIFPGAVEAKGVMIRGQYSGPKWDWRELSQLLAKRSPGEAKRILVTIQLRQEALIPGATGAPFPTVASIEREDLTEIRNGLVLAAALIQAEHHVTPTFDIQLDNGMAGPDELYPSLRANAFPFDPEDSEKIEGYSMAWTVFPSAPSGDRLFQADFGSRYAFLGYWNGKLPQAGSNLSADFARAYRFCQHKLDGETRMLAGQEEMAEEVLRGSAQFDEPFAYVGSPEGTFGSQSGRIDEPVGRRNGRFVLFRAPQPRSVAASELHLKCKGLGNAAYYVRYEAPGVVESIAGWIGPEKDMKPLAIPTAVIPSDSDTLVLKLPATSVPVQEITLVPADAAGFSLLREPASLEIVSASLTDGPAFLPPADRTSVEAGLAAPELEWNLRALGQAATMPETAPLRTNVAKFLRSANRTLSRAAAQCLRAWGSPDAVAALRSVLDKGPFEHGQELAANALTDLLESKRITGEDAMIDEASALLANREWRSRYAAARLLGAMTQERANIALMLMLGDPEPIVRLEAVNKANLNLSLINQRILYAAVNDPYEVVRIAAVRKALSSPLPEVRKDAEGFLADDSPRVVEVVVRSGGLSQSLLERALLSPHPRVVGAALQQLALAKKPVAADAVRHLFTSENAMIQFGLAHLHASHAVKLPADVIERILAGPSPGAKRLLQEAKGH